MAIDPKNLQRKRKPASSLVTQGEVEQWIMEDLEALEEVTEAYDDTCKRLASAEADYKRKRSGRYMNASGTVRDREMYAEKVSMVEYETYLKEKEAKEGLYQVIWTIRNRIETLRSINANIRSQTN